MKDNILSYETVRLLDEERAIEIIDQTLLPNEVKLVKLDNSKQYYDAIKLLMVRGAPAIGVFAGFAYYLEAAKIASEVNCNVASDFYERLHDAKEYLNSSRPTAVNLSWALNRMESVTDRFAGKITAGGKNVADEKITAGGRDVLSADGNDLNALLAALKNEADLIKEEDTAMCRAIGEHALKLVKKGDGLLTHCNAGQLATSKYGTATSVMYLGHEKGYDFKIYCDETRPLLQGARLTAFELSSAGMDVTVLCDNMVASLMKSGAINAVFVGADRVAANGDTANKIGTSVVATVAKHFNVPFYVCAPSSTIDVSLKDGSEIPIEQRDGDEVTRMWYEKRMAPEGIKVYNPAFDVTDHSLITGIITEKGVFTNPFDFVRTLS